MERLKELRKENKKTQKDIAKLLGMTQASYQFYESGLTEPNIENLIKLADIYNVSLDYLVGRHFGNDLGFLTSEQFNIIKTFLMLTHDNQLIISGRILALLENQ